MNKVISILVAVIIVLILVYSLVVVTGKVYKKYVSETSESSGKYIDGLQNVNKESTSEKEKEGGSVKSKEGG